MNPTLHRLEVAAASLQKARDAYAAYLERRTLPAELLGTGSARTWEPPPLNSVDAGNLALAATAAHVGAMLADRAAFDLDEGIAGQVDRLADLLAAGKDQA